MCLRSPWLAVLALAVLTPAEAAATGAAVGKQGESVAITTARIAVAAAPARTTRWAQVSVAGASDGFVWIVPVRRGGRIDLASDAWLDALDAATAPVVLPPIAPDLCDAGTEPERIAPATSPESARPTQTAAFTDGAMLAAFVNNAGYAIPAWLSGPLEAVFSAGDAVLAATYGSAALPTRAIRIVDDGPPTLPLALTWSMGEAHVTAFALGAGGASAGASPLAIDPSEVLWEGSGQSTYVAERDALAVEWKGARWLTEGALPDLLFDGVSLGPGAAAPLPAVLAGYFTLSHAYGEETAEPAACSAAAYETRTDSAPFAAECPAGALGIAPGPSPCAASGDGGTTPADALRCGAADDAVFAVAGLSPANVWVTRIEGIVAAATATDVPITIATVAPTSPVVTAGAYASTCVAPTPPEALPPPASPPPAAQPSQPPSSDSSAADVAPAAAEGCAAIADSCGSSDASDDDRSGGCSSSSDPPSDGSSSSGGCGSGSSDQSSSNCATASRPRPQGRSPVSRVLLGCAAAAAMARRRRWTKRAPV
jgi:hypothetical protein